MCSNSVVNVSSCIRTVWTDTTQVSLFFPLLDLVIVRRAVAYRIRGYVFFLQTDLVTSYRVEG